MSYEDPNYKNKQWTMYVMDGFNDTFTLTNPLHVPRIGERIEDFNYTPSPKVTQVSYNYKEKYIRVLCE